MVMIPRNIQIQTHTKIDYTLVTTDYNTSIISSKLYVNEREAKQPIIDDKTFSIKSNHGEPLKAKDENRG